MQLNEELDFPSGPEKPGFLVASLLGMTVEGFGRDLSADRLVLSTVMTFATPAVTFGTNLPPGKVD